MATKQEMDDFFRKMGIDPDAVPPKPLTKSQEAGKHALDEIKRMKERHGKDWE